MVAKKAGRLGKGDVELNMTPMIDVVFNLIIFFMLVTDMTRKEFAELTLPSAELDGEIEPDDTRIIVNVVKAGDWDQSKDIRILVKGRPYDLDRLREHLFCFAERHRDEPGGFSRATVLIRCDRDIRWREVQWVMQTCAHDAVRIHRLEFATADHVQP